jgi:hypothetical protein
MSPDPRLSAGKIIGIDITLFNNGNPSPDDTFGHEVLHPAYSVRMSPIGSGWDGLPQTAHQNSFDEAAKKIK